MGTYLIIGALLVLAIVGAMWLRPRDPAPGINPWPTNELPPTEIEPGPMRWAPAPGESVRYPIEPSRRAMVAAVRYSWAADIIYFDEEGTRTERTIWPKYMRGENHVRAFCELRQDDRTFRLDRIQRIRVRAATAATSRKYEVG